VIIILVVVHISLWENLKNYLRDKLYVDFDILKKLLLFFFRLVLLMFG